ncbi:hypothetical protein M885DRAFT_539598 [Pelagophyceae sp. CCMP2097]|nr:hypothetical protein M885DRAFT_539598 [Pelagophyceae sp. CCMP2097]|mmetsp:Transcript_30415/g.104583  ORF Transcript_30415/g.104583 Transcript_30415/m.104583 type:complete len:440 (-) Transcript_30415:26-1345(-)
MQRVFCAVVCLAASASSRQSIRKEIRNLTDAELDLFVDAMWTLKRVDAATGVAKYGDAFKPYDYFVAKHIDASLNYECDVAHFSPIFSIWHRALEVEFEKSLLAVEPLLPGLPYWDYRQDAEAPAESAVFSSKYFGAFVGDASKGFQVTNGRFGNWPVASGNSTQTNWTNLHGFLRGPMSMNDAPTNTRNGGTMCGVPMGVGNASGWDRCLGFAAIKDFHYCLDFDVHGMAHFGVGGGWPRFEAQVPIEKPTSLYEPPECASFYGMVGDVIEGRGKGSYRYPLTRGCLVCPDCDAKGLAAEECVCTCANADCSCPGLWSGDPSIVETIVDPERVQVVGDMYDPISSPNDPLFFLHHANMDRYLSAWMHKHRDQSPFFNFPEDPKTEPYCSAHLLDGTLGGPFPFFGLVRGAAADVPMTVRDVFTHYGIHTAPYVYDTLQ